MVSKIVHIYGPLYINSYGVAIGIALIVFTQCLKYDKKRQQLIAYDKLLQLFTWGILIGVIGGRALYVMSEWNLFTHFGEIFALWEGGFSILGTILAVTSIIPFIIKKWNIPVLPLLDRCALYAPLVQSISRIGCFFAGCCYGAPSNICWSITYTDVDGIAPLYCSLHPAQLYSSLLLLFIFVFLYFVAQHRTKKDGDLLMLYLLLQSGERFIVDFYRGDRIYSTMVALPLFSLYQWISVAIAASVLVYVWINSATTVKTR